MLSRTFNQIAQSPWAKLIWAGVAVLALIQVVVLYQLCISQVERAQHRETVAVEQRNSFSDCLDSRKSTISSCNRRATARTSTDTNSLSSRDMPRARTSNSSVFSGAVPVSYVFH